MLPAGSCTLGSVSAFASLSLEPWVVATPGLRPRLAERVLGFERDALRWYDPTRCSSERFLDQLERIDELTFGPLGLRMPRWAFYDCAELPGALFGFGASRPHLPESVRARLPDAEPFMPISMCMATPMVRPDEWLTFSISSLLDLEPGPDAVSLGVETLALTLAALRPRRVHGTMQWRSPSLAVHARFAPLEVRAAWVPAHTHAATCVFAFDVDEGLIERARSRPDLTTSRGTIVDPEDAAGLEELQRRIEAGGSLRLLGATPSSLACVAWGDP